MSPPLSIVVAVAANGIIGRDNALPWRLRTDLKRFRALTWGKPLVMGRRNWDSIGRPLPGRETVVLTRDPTFRADGAHVVHDWAAARARAAALAAAMAADEIAIVGGAEIYRLALPETDTLRLTLVHARPEGDVVFPAYEPADFVETAREDLPAGPDDAHAVTFLDLRRRRAGTPA